MPVLAVPVVPSLSCPASASALGTAGLAPVCRAGGAVVGAVSSTASQVAGFSVDAVLDGIAGWVSSGAVWLLGQVGAFLSSSTSVDLGASWFTDHYRTMAGLAGVVVVPLLLAGVIQSIHRQSGAVLARSVLVNVPLAILLTAVAVQLVQLGLALTDTLSTAVAQGTGVDTGHLFDPVIVALDSPAAGPTPGPPTFIVLLGSLAVVLGAFLLWVELLVRAAAVYVAVLFLPMALASLAWPAIAHWCRRLVDTLAALVLGKFVIVTVLSLGVSALGAGAGSPAGPGFSAVLAGAAMLALAAASPWALFRLLPFLEAGAVGHLEGAGRRTLQTATGPGRSLAESALRAVTVGGAGEVGMAAAAGAAAAPTGDGMGGGGDEDAVPRSRTPDLGPSSLETRGVGEASTPGSSIPGWPVDVAATRTFAEEMARGSGDPGSGPVPALPVGALGGDDPAAPGVDGDRSESGGG